jgi:hypothetical protein
MQWESSGIYVWLFPRNAIPADITNKQANPAGWGTPRGTFPFGKGCDVGYFYNHHIIIDNTFCGDWAGATFGAQCGGDCNSFVQNNPGIRRGRIGRIGKRERERERERERKKGRGKKGREERRG